jgi:sucrose-6-phosphate hydrolase SacC (GH32 family)
MWECPDLFTLGADTFLICCPQGVAREAHRFLNTHPSAYLSGTFTLNRRHLNMVRCMSLTPDLSFTPRKPP